MLCERDTPEDLTSAAKRLCRLSSSRCCCSCSWW